MILIADSGSSKTHWVLETEQGLKEFFTIGINPFFVTEEIVHNELDMSGIKEYAGQVSEILFYGASCSSDDRKEKIRVIFKSYFTHAKKILVDHDLVASCLALFGDKPGIACIIGTGSNSCVWDGKEVTANVPALGYILGDEAAGVYIGKEILRHYLYETLPEPIHDWIKKEYRIDKEDVFNAVYKGDFPNKYLASFSTVAEKFRSDPFIQDILHIGFNEFIVYHILCYPESESLPIGCVGSIAEVFRKEFEEELENEGLRLSLVIQSPIHNLVQYHLGRISSM